LVAETQALLLQPSNERLSLSNPYAHAHSLTNRRSSSRARSNHDPTRPPFTRATPRPTLRVV